MIVLARSTVNQAGLGAGQEAWVDTSNPVIAEMLEHGWLVQVPTDELPPEELEPAVPAPPDG